MYNVSRSRSEKQNCTGCPLFTMCLGHPSDAVSLVDTICACCLNVRIDQCRIPGLELCREMYKRIVVKEGIWVSACLETLGCERKLDELRAKDMMLLDNETIMFRAKRLPRPDYNTLVFRGEPDGK